MEELGNGMPTERQAGCDYGKGGPAPCGPCPSGRFRLMMPKEQLKTHL